MARHKTAYPTNSKSSNDALANVIDAAVSEELGALRSESNDLMIEAARIHSLLLQQIAGRSKLGA